MRRRGGRGREGCRKTVERRRGELEFERGRGQEREREKNEDQYYVVTSSISMSTI